VTAIRTNTTAYFAGMPMTKKKNLTPWQQDAVMAWLTDQKTGSFIEKVTPALLQVRHLTFYSAQFLI
jgi:predicted transcriptional regulator